MAITNELVIDATVERVWDLTVDIETWPTMTPTMTSVERLDDGSLRVGSQARIKQPRQPVRVWTITDLEPRSRFVWATSLLWWRMVASHRLSTDGPDRCRNVLTVELSGPLASVGETLLRRPLQQAIAGENSGFRRAAESSRQQHRG